MNSKNVLTIVKDYEREKIYRLNRRLDGLNELLETIDNTKIQFLNPDVLKQSIKRDIDDSKNRIQKWWDIIFERYNLPRDKEVFVSFDTGEIVEK